MNSSHEPPSNHRPAAHRGLPRDARLHRRAASSTPSSCGASPRSAFKNQADGSLVTYNGKVVGSSLLCQEFVDAKGNPLPQYFQPRPSNADSSSVKNDYGCDPGFSGASNLGPNNPTLLTGRQAAPGGRSPSSTTCPSRRCRRTRSPRRARASTRTSRPSTPPSRSTGWRRPGTCRSHGAGAGQQEHPGPDHRHPRRARGWTCSTLNIALDELPGSAQYAGRWRRRIASAGRPQWNASKDNGPAGMPGSLGALAHLICHGSMGAAAFPERSPHDRGVHAACPTGRGRHGPGLPGLLPGGRAVAVKVVHPSWPGTRSSCARFRHEVAAAGAVSGMYTAPVVASGLQRQTRPGWPPRTCRADARRRRRQARAAAGCGALAARRGAGRGAARGARLRPGPPRPQARQRAARRRRAAGDRLRHLPGVERRRS